MLHRTIQYAANIVMSTLRERQNVQHSFATRSWEKLNSGMGLWTIVPHCGGIQ